MSTTKPTPKRWFRWSLRTMFVAVTVLCVWLRYQMNWAQQRRAVLESNETVISTIVMDDASTSFPWPLALVGESPVARGIILPKETTDEELRRVQTLFPETPVGRWPRPTHN